MKETKKRSLKRQEIMDCIMEIVNKEGYESLTIRDICKKANISIGTFYHYFEEKSDILRVLFKGIDDFFENEVVGQFGEDSLKNILIFVKNYASYCVKSGVKINKEIATAPLNNMDKSYLSSNRSLSTIIHQVVLEGQDKEQITMKYSAQQIAQMVLVCMRGYCADWSKCNGSYDLEQAIELHFKVLAEGLRA